MEEPPGFEPGIAALQAAALPLGDSSVFNVKQSDFWRSHLGFKPGDSSFAELRPYHLAMTPYLQSLSDQNNEHIVST